MAFAPSPYDSSSLGPSQGGAIDQMAAQNTDQTFFDTAQKNTQVGRSMIQEADYSRPQLQSSMGASGQYYSGAARQAEDKQHIDFQNQRADIQSSFNRAQMDMQRSQVFAGLGLII